MGFVLRLWPGYNGHVPGYGVGGVSVGAGNLLVVTFLVKVFFSARTTSRIGKGKGLSAGGVAVSSFGTVGFSKIVSFGCRRSRSAPRVRVAMSRGLRPCMGVSVRSHILAIKFGNTGISRFAGFVIGAGSG